MATTRSNAVEGEPLADEQAGRARRRRGATLEGAILDAVWDELKAVGYANLTMEGVAARAKTSRAVLYRRWRGRPELVLAAMRAHAPLLSGPVPDTGSLREDMVALMRRMSRRVSQRLDELGQEVMSDFFGDAELFTYLQTQVLQVGVETMMTILGHAAERGEVRLDGITSRIATLPIDLARHDMLLTRAPLTESAIMEILDDIFLPLILDRKDAAQEEDMECG